MSVGQIAPHKFPTLETSNAPYLNFKINSRPKGSTGIYKLENMELQTVNLSN